MREKSKTMFDISSNDIPSGDDLYTTYEFAGEESNAEAELTVCAETGGVNGGVEDGEGNEYEIASQEDGSHIWFVVDMEAIEELRNAKEELQVCRNKGVKARSS